MFLPMLKVELWEGVFVTASQSLPPITGICEGSEDRIFLLPPEWSQWWWVFTMAVKLRSLDFSERMGATLNEAAG